MHGLHLLKWHKVCHAHKCLHVITVKLVYNDHFWDPKKVVAVGTRSLFGDHLCNKSSKYYLKGSRYRQVVVNAGLNVNIIEANHLSIFIKCTSNIRRKISNKQVLKKSSQTCALKKRAVTQQIFRPNDIISLELPKKTVYSGDNHTNLSILFIFKFLLLS